MFINFLIQFLVVVVIWTFGLTVIHRQWFWCYTSPDDDQIRSAGYIQLVGGIWSMTIALGGLILRDQEVMGWSLVCMTIVNIISSSYYFGWGDRSTEKKG